MKYIRPFANSVPRHTFLVYKKNKSPMFIMVASFTTAPKNTKECIGRHNSPPPPKLSNLILTSCDLVSEPRARLLIPALFSRIVYIPKNNTYHLFRFDLPLMSTVACCALLTIR